MTKAQWALLKAFLRLAACFMMGSVRFSPTPAFVEALTRWERALIHADLTDKEFNKLSPADL